MHLFCVEISIIFRIVSQIQLHYTLKMIEMAASCHLGNFPFFDQLTAVNS